MTCKTEGMDSDDGATEPLNPPTPDLRKDTKRLNDNSSPANNTSARARRGNRLPAKFIRQPRSIDEQNPPPPPQHQQQQNTDQDEITDCPLPNSDDPQRNGNLGEFAGLKDPRDRGDVNYIRAKQDSRTCCSKCVGLRKLLARIPWKKRRHPEDDAEIEELKRSMEDPLRKRCLRACFNFIYTVLAVVAIFVTYSMVQDLITSMKHPVRSINYQKVKQYPAPGIAVYPGGAKFHACGHYYNNVVTSKVRLSDLDLQNLNCSYQQMTYEDPHYPGIARDVIVLRGPTDFERREALFIHFSLNDETRDFFTVSYFVFPEWDQFNSSTEDGRVTQLLEYHRYVPTFALSAGLRMWIKLIMSETLLMDGSNYTDFKVEYSVVDFWDRRSDEKQKDHLFFIFFEWKSDIIEQSRLLYTTTPWSIGAGLCAVFLMLHRGYQLAQTSYRRIQKDKQRRTIRKRTINELRRQRSQVAEADV